MPACTIRRRVPHQTGHQNRIGSNLAMLHLDDFMPCLDQECVDIISIDGKCLRRSLDASSSKAAIYMVSAWSSRNQLVLGQQRVDDKSNEITAIPSYCHNWILQAP